MQTTNLVPLNYHEFKAAVIRTLTNTKERQTANTLYDSVDRCYCAMGVVANELFNIPANVMRNKASIFHLYPLDGLTKEHQTTIETLRSLTKHRVLLERLMVLNDEMEMTFKQIAKQIADDED